MANDGTIGTYRRAILYLSTRSPKGASLRTLVNMQALRTVAFIWGKRPIGVATDVLEFEKRATLGASQWQNKQQSLGPTRHLIPG